MAKCRQRLTQAEHDEMVGLARIMPLLTLDGFKRMRDLEDRSFIYGSDGIKPRALLGLQHRY